MTENYMIINGTRYPVINSWVETESRGEGRKRWGIVTELPEQPEQPEQPCGRCGQPPAAHTDTTGHLWIRLMAYQDAPESTYEQLPDNFADIVDELSRPIVSDNGTVIPPAIKSEQPDDSCRKCRTPFDDTDPSLLGKAQQGGTPYCRSCVSHCHDTEIADHWCVIDEWRNTEGTKP